MCGICGKLNFDRENHVTPDYFRRMLHTIRHRGPDGEGVSFRKRRIGAPETFPSSTSRPAAAL